MPLIYCNPRQVSVSSILNADKALEMMIGYSGKKQWKRDASTGKTNKEKVHPLFHLW